MKHRVVIERSDGMTVMVDLSDDELNNLMADDIGMEVLNALEALNNVPELKKYAAYNADNAAAHRADAIAYAQIPKRKDKSK